MFEISDLSTRINRRIRQNCHVSIVIRSISNFGKFNIEIWKSEFKREFCKSTKFKNKHVQNLNLHELESYDVPAIGENSIELLRLQIRPAREKSNVSWIFFYRSVISRQSTLYSLSNERNAYEQIRIKNELESDPYAVSRHNTDSSFSSNELQFNETYTRIVNRMVKLSSK